MVLTGVGNSILWSKGKFCFQTSKLQLIVFQSLIKFSIFLRISILYLNMQNLEQLLHINQKLQTEIEQRLNSLSIQLATLYQWPQDYTQLSAYSGLYQVWKNSGAKKLLQLQERILARGQKAEQIRRYQQIIQQLLRLLKEKQQEVAVFQNQRRNIKRVGYNFQNISYQEQKQGTAILIKQLRQKDLLQKCIAGLQYNQIVSRSQNEDFDALQTSFIQTIFKQIHKNQELKFKHQQLQEQMRYLESQQIQRNYLNLNRAKVIDQSQTVENLKSTKTISQTSDED